MPVLCVCIRSNDNTRFGTAQQEVEMSRMPETASKSHYMPYVSWGCIYGIHSVLSMEDREFYSPVQVLSPHVCTRFPHFWGVPEHVSGTLSDATVQTR